MKIKMRYQIYKDVFCFIWIPVIISIFISCFEGIMSVFCADILGKFADAVFVLDFSNGVENVGRLVLVLLATALAIPLISFINDIILVKEALAHDRVVLGRFLDKNCVAAEKIDAGDMLDRLDEDPNDFRHELITIFSASFMIPITLTYLLIKLVQISKVYTIVILGISLINFFIPWIVRTLEQKYHKENKEYSSCVRSYETELTDKAYLIDLYGLGKLYITRLEQLYRDFFQKTKIKNICLEAFVAGINSFINTFCILLILLLGAYSVAKGWLSPGAVAAMIGYFAVFNTIIRNVNTIIHEFPIIKNLVERLEYFYGDTECVTGEVLIDFERINISNLMFSYEEKIVLDSVSFVIEKGEKVALCGKNGSGKSTIIKILLGLVYGYAGEIKINGINFLEINIDTFREILAYAPQNPYIFNGTVMENIQIANKNIKESEIKELMKYFGIGYLVETEVDYGGNKLSGGEKQKISIIRAIIKNSPIIFIDEPENNLDSSALELLKQMICSSDKTIVYVSHNKMLIDCADKQIYLS